MKSTEAMENKEAFGGKAPLSPGWRTGLVVVGGSRMQSFLVAPPLTVLLEGLSALA